MACLFSVKTQGLGVTLAPDDLVILRKEADAFFAMMDGGIMSG
jgi:hypothetical protein